MVQNELFQNTAQILNTLICYNIRTSFVFSVISKRQNMCVFMTDLIDEDDVRHWMISGECFLL